MLWRRKATPFCPRPGLVDFPWVSVFATSSFGSLLFKLTLCVEKGVLLWAVRAETTGYTCHSVLYSHTQAFMDLGRAFEDPPPTAAWQLLGDDGVTLLLTNPYDIVRGP